MFSRRDILLTMSSTDGRKRRGRYPRSGGLRVGGQAADGEPFYFYGEFAAAEAPSSALPKQFQTELDLP